MTKIYSPELLADPGDPVSFIFKPARILSGKLSRLVLHQIRALRRS